MTAGLSRRTSIGTLAFLFLSTTAIAQTPAPTVRAEFTDSTLAGLAPTKRVAITSVIVSFQASVGAKKEAGSGMFADKTESTSTLGLTDIDAAMQDAIAAEAYRHLKADLIAAGYEIVPEAEVAADASYRELISKAGFVNHSKSANLMGDAMLVSPPTLTPYMPYTMEGSRFQNLPSSYLGWGAGWGKPATPGGYSLMNAATFWKLPGLESQMAKTLNANVVKAFFVVTLGQATVESSASSNAYRTSGEGSTTVVAQSGLLPDQTRISFRSPTGTGKWQKVSPNKPLPAKDGDVVVHLAEPMLGSKDLFAVDTSGKQRGMWLHGVGDFKFTSTATIKDGPAYQREIDAMIATATTSMVALVRR
ncbi:MAG: hypothetical protein ABI668_07370 [Sphingorhabdus sp.]